MINVKNTDDKECFKWSRIIAKPDKDFAKILDFKDIKFPVKIRDIHKIENTAFGYENKKKYRIYVSKECCKEEHVD